MYACRSLRVASDLKDLLVSTSQILGLKAYATMTSSLPEILRILCHFGKLYFLLKLTHFKKDILSESQGLVSPCWQETIYHKTKINIQKWHHLLKRKREVRDFKFYINFLKKINKGHKNADHAVQPPPAKWKWKWLGTKVINEMCICSTIQNKLVKEKS